MGDRCRFGSRLWTLWKSSWTWMAHVSLITFDFASKQSSRKSDSTCSSCNDCSLRLQCRGT